MMKNVNQRGDRAAFTIVELLTVMAVIAILIGLLVPALGLVHDTAQDLQQKAQFHGIKVGLELYKSEYGVYPESNDNQYDVPPLNAYSGAHKLAEAMVGFDLMGFHPSSEFREDGRGPDPLGGGAMVNLYTNTTLEDREERFIDLEKSNAYKLGQVYGNTSPFNADNFVLCDSYAKRRQISGKKIGMPVLYYSADTKFKIQDSSNPNVSIYDYRDNESMLQLGLPDDPAFDHPLSFGVNPNLFDEVILNDQIEVTGTPVPYRAQSFILISAGKDGVFGNADDIYNFDKEK